VDEIFLKKRHYCVRYLVSEIRCSFINWQLILEYIHTHFQASILTFIYAIYPNSSHLLPTHYKDLNTRRTSQYGLLYFYSLTHIISTSQPRSHPNFHFKYLNTSRHVLTQPNASLYIHPLCSLSSLTAFYHYPYTTFYHYFFYSK